jgi:hypothetical protein
LNWPNHSATIWYRKPEKRNPIKTGSTKDFSYHEEAGNTEAPERIRFISIPRPRISLVKQFQGGTPNLALFAMITGQMTADISIPGKIKNHEKYQENQNGPSEIRDQCHDTHQEWDQKNQHIRDHIFPCEFFT